MALVASVPVLRFVYLVMSVPPEVVEFVKVAQEMEYEETPNYEGFREIIDRYAKRIGFRTECLFDWLPQPPECGATSTASSETSVWPAASGNALVTRFTARNS